MWRKNVIESCKMAWVGEVRRAVCINLCIVWDDALIASKNYFSYEGKENRHSNRLILYIQCNKWININISYDFTLPFLGFASYQWLLYFSSRTITSEPRKSCSWLSLSGLDCCLSRRILITNSTAEFTSVFMLVVEWCWWGEPMMLDVCICWNKNLDELAFLFLFYTTFGWNVCTFYSPLQKVAGSFSIEMSWNTK